MNQRIDIDSQQLAADLADLARIGATADGGVTRLTNTPDEAAARAWVRERLSALGLAVVTDAAGSTFGHYQPNDAASGRGAGASEPAVLFGSHLDTVPNGGRYDGALGVVAALAAARALLASGVKLKPFSVACWADEEGARFGAGLFGSRAATGDVAPDELTTTHDRDGICRAEAMRSGGLDPARIGEAVLAPGSAAAYCELHIEQGGNLIGSGTEIGIVEGIVGIHRFDVTFHGLANHAGTTPMHLRHDALRGAARLISALPGIVAEQGSGRSVGTVGQVSVAPGAANVIPGEARVTVELRDLSTEVLARLDAAVDAAAHDAAVQEGLTVDVALRDLARPAPCDEGLRARLAAVCDARGYSHLSLPSGAGHDAQSLANICPVAMVFVPSRDGISHSPKEYTAPADCARGAQVLTDLVAELCAR